MQVNESAASVNQEADTGMQNEKMIIEDLDVEILEAIGIRVAQERVLTPAIPRSIAVRMEDILKKGLSKEEREKLIKIHVPSKNCTFIDPPKLNEEIKASINETSSKRDARIIEKQMKITAVLALLGSTIADIINISSSSNENKKLSPPQIALVRKLSEATRLLADLQRDESLTRRSLILATISSSQKEMLELASTDKWLFGQKLGDRLKAAKSIERSGKELKTKPKNLGKSKNFKDPPRRQPFKSTMSGGYQNRSYGQNQPNKKNWRRQNKENRSNQKTETPSQQKKD